MPEKAPITTDLTHLKLKEIAGEFGVTATELNRRVVSFPSVSRAHI